ncbi:hypothetical protein GCM10012278_40270 [Nonomuraea glycinis]|uniref:Uncharacterized protein n=1 Tax=Nonomuraea glycinis TaxID=2047744 RepID=A0A918A834_9ACTN|nr:hypothetical protein GCM10012278_40270 [Nonomuraea glycinis]
MRATAVGGAQQDDAGDAEPGGHRVEDLAEGATIFVCPLRVAFEVGCGAWNSEPQVSVADGMHQKHSGVWNLILRDRETEANWMRLAPAADNSDAIEN